MKRVVVGLLVTAFAVAGCGEPTAPLPKHGVPDELEFSIGGWGTAFSSWSLHGDTLVHRSADFEVSPATVPEARTIPSAEAWSAFWLELERIGVRRWRDKYLAELIADGEGWHTRIRAGNVLVESSGSNAYPDEMGREHEGSRTPAFAAYIAAFQNLSGGSN